MKEDLCNYVYCKNNIDTEKIISVSIYKPPSSGPTVMSIRDQEEFDPCENCEAEGEACLYCLDESATKNMLSLQDIEKVLLSYGMDQYEVDSIMFKMKAEMRGKK